MINDHRAFPMVQGGRKKGRALWKERVSEQALGSWTSRSLGGKFNPWAEGLLG